MAQSLPENLEAERSLLGILLLGEEEAWDEIASTLKETDFFQPAHRKIFQNVKELHQRGQPSDVITLANLLKKKDLLEQVGGTAYLSELIHELPSSVNISSYAQIIKEKALLREVIHISEGFIDKAQKESYTKIEHFIDSLESEIFRLNQTRVQSELLPITDLVEPGLKKLEELYYKKISLTGLPSYFHELDNLTSGFQPSELIIIAARPSMGKTALSLNIALNNALNKKKVAFFSLEMSREQVLMRLLSSLSQINLSQIMTGQVADYRWEKLIAVAGQLSNIPFFIDDSSPLSPYEIRTKARRMKAREGLDLIVVDYLQLMQLPERAESREREVSEMSRLLKAFSKELNIPIIALSQLNRGVESRSNRRPILSDLRESGAIEQDADVIMMLYREDYYEEGEAAGTAEVIINKHRNGPTGTVTLRWVPEYATFENDVSQEETQAPPPPPAPEPQMPF